MWEANRRRDPLLSVVGRNTTFLMMDYFWLTQTYLSKDLGG